MLSCQTGLSGFQAADERMTWGPVTGTELSELARGIPIDVERIETNSRTEAMGITKRLEAFVGSAENA